MKELIDIKNLLTPKTAITFIRNSKGINITTSHKILGQIVVTKSSVIAKLQELKTNDKVGFKVEYYNDGSIVFNI